MVALAARLVPLGTCSANKNPARAFSSYLFEFGPRHVLVDVGSYRVKRYPFDFTRLRHVCLTHAHFDHTRYLWTLVARYVDYWERHAKRPPLAPREAAIPPLVLVFPATFKFVAQIFLGALGGSLRHWKVLWRHVKLCPVFPRWLPGPRVLARLALGDQAQLLVIAARARHVRGTVGYGFEVRRDASRGVPELKVAIAPDTRWSEPGIVALARDADYLFHDCTWPEARLHLLEHDYPRAFRREGHSSPSRAAKTATAAGTRALGAIHYWDARFPNKAQMEAEIRAHFPGKVILTRDLVPVPLVPSESASLATERSHEH